MDNAKSYSDYRLHREISKILRNRSENKRDVRDIVKNMIEWDKTRRMLDLGCGYGWFEDALEIKIDFIAGIDSLKENGPPFVGSAKRVTRDAVFKMITLPAPIDFSSDSFDLIVSAYSLYFFPGVLSDARRLLQNEGLFVVITHSETMLEEGEKYFNFKNLRKVIENFSAENGGDILKKYFSRVNFVDYQNSLLFRRGNEEELKLYIDFKREFIREDVDPDLVKETMLRELLRKGEVCFNKNDRIFLARK
ncbi:MAG: hypothetical protein C0399_04650 [Syntrophus sp. (in: bacteria)]|nr:hypothetical protein [Syntrophus sp. (in: bacteria)]